MRQSVLFFLFLLFATPLFANCKSDEQLGFRSYNFRIENDYFNNEDSNYTSGVILSGVTHDFKGDIKNDCLPMISQFHGNLLTYVDEIGRAHV